MTTITLYAAALARFGILLLGFILLPLFFLIYVLSLLSETYLKALFSFVASTQSFLTHAKEQVNKRTNEPS